MKFKHLLLTASVMALFSSCSNDELVSESTSHGDAIAFSVTTSNATRAHDYWCNNNLPNNFAVSASLDGKTYFDGDVFKKDGDKYITNDGNVRYWPEMSNEKPLNVYAYKVKDDAAAEGAGFATFNWNNGVPTIDMTPAPAAADQHDLLYAYTKVTAKPEFGKTAAINFRHALSQIVFYAKCENTKVYVEIEEIALMNAATSGTFTLPTGDNTTSPNFVEHNQAGTVTPQPSTGLGTWALTYNTANKANPSYTASCTKVVDSKTVLTALTPGKETWTNLTDQVNAEGTYTESEYTQSLLVLPHGKKTNNPGEKLAKYVPYTTSEGENPTKTYKALSEVGGACIAIKCRIRNIAGASVEADDVYLWGSAPTGENSGAKYLVVPVDFTWEQGKKYIYRINFSKLGHGGYNPEDGKEVLVPIQLSVTVDDFATAPEIIENI